MGSWAPAWKPSPNQKQLRLEQYDEILYITSGWDSEHIQVPDWLGLEFQVQDLPILCFRT